jgi:hypothetical protein
VHSKNRVYCLPDLRHQAHFLSSLIVFSSTQEDIGPGVPTVDRPAALQGTHYSILTESARRIVSPDSRAPSGAHHN